MTPLIQEVTPSSNSTSVNHTCSAVEKSEKNALANIAAGTSIIMESTAHPRMAERARHNMPAPPWGTKLPTPVPVSTRLKKIISMNKAGRYQPGRPITLCVTSNTGAIRASMNPC